MEKIFSIILQTRKNFIQLSSELSLEQLNKIPGGFNNNVVWNLGHILSSQEVICSLLSKHSPNMDLSMLERYRKGTKPEGFVGREELEQIRELLLSTPEMIRRKLAASSYQEYTEQTLHYGVTLRSVEDAVRFVATHDAMHYGYAKAIARLV